MSLRPSRYFVTSTIGGVAWAVAAALVVAQSGQDTAADFDRLIKALDIHAGSVVGEIGAGDGALTVAIGKAVGDAGRVFSNELSKDRLAAIGKAVDEAGLKNVTTIEGAESDTRFSDQCCDAIFMRDVYHHFSDPAAMNASIYRSLKPGGRVAILDFGPPPGGESADPAGRARDGHHGITPPTLERELRAAGFEIVSTIEWPFRSFMIVARRALTFNDIHRHATATSPRSRSSQRPQRKITKIGLDDLRTRGSEDSRMRDSGSGISD